MTDGAKDSRDTAVVWESPLNKSSRCRAPETIKWHNDHGAATVAFGTEQVLRKRLLLVLSLLIMF